MTATDLLPRLAAIGAHLARSAPALVVALLAFLESLARALDAAHAERKAPAPVVIAHVDVADTAIASTDELLEFLRRLLGWSAERLADVEHAFRAACEMAGGRAALLLIGEGSLLGVARRLHWLTLGGDQPFVELGPGDSMTEAMERAAGGMLYIDARHLPRDLAPLASGVRDARVRLVVGAERTPGDARFAAMLPRVATIAIPPLRERREEIDAVIEAFGQDAVANLGAPQLGFRPYDLKWIRERASRTFADIEEVTHRLVATRNFGVTAGAERLGITHGALSRWIRRRGIPT